MQIGKLTTWTATDTFSFLLLHAPRQTRTFWYDVYVPTLDDRDGAQLEQRVGAWCGRWKIGSDRRCCASKLLIYACDAYWRECATHQALSPEEARFLAAVHNSQMHYFNSLLS